MGNMRSNAFTLSPVSRSKRRARFRKTAALRCIGFFPPAVQIIRFAHSPISTFLQEEV
jgi:hypothetical protein